jgi:transposase
MIQIAPQMRILVAIEPADFRKGIDGLAKLAREELASDPFSGCVFVFRNRRGTAVKILVYDGQGFWLCQKRLSQGRFRFWPSGKTARGLEAHELQVLLSAGDFKAAQAAPPWRRVCADT